METKPRFPKKLSTWIAIASVSLVTAMAGVAFWLGGLYNVLQASLGVYTPWVVGLFCAAVGGAGIYWAIHTASRKVERPLSVAQGLSRLMEVI